MWYSVTRYTQRYIIHTEKNMIPCPHNCSTVWDARLKVLLVGSGSTYARGLVKTLETSFTPAFSIARALRGATGTRTPRGGCQLGIEVDEMVDHWVSSGRPFVPDTTLRSRMFEEIRSRLTIEGLVPVASQLPVGCVGLRLATRVDLVCRGRSGGLVLVEIKCGFDTYYDVSNQGYMMDPFGDIPATYRNKHALQLSVTSLLFRHGHHSLSRERLDGACVIRVYTDADETVYSEVDHLPLYLVTDLPRMTRCLLLLAAGRNDVTGRKVSGSEPRVMSSVSY
jgi:hypothetical protein